MSSKLSHHIHRLVFILLFLCVVTTAADIFSQWDCTFTLHVTDFQPSTSPAVVMSDVSTFSVCAHACLGRLNRRCRSVGFLSDQRECRMYSAFDPNDVTVASPGLKYYKGCVITESCKAYHEEGVVESGGYFLDLEELGPPLPVFCDMDSDGGGWTVFQKRQDGSVDFYRNWADYRDGFGDIMGEHWLGNAALHALTKTQGRELLVRLTAWDGDSAWAYYSSFSVANEVASFRLTVTGYNGTAGDALAANNGFKFTTLDRDNDNYRDNCAVWWQGAWWYKWCGQSNPNGVYQHSAVGGWTVPRWDAFKGNLALRFIEMKLR